MRWMTTLGQLLLLSGCQHGAPDTPLTSAASAGDAIEVQTLLAQHADPNTCDGTGWAPLHWAVRYGHAETIRILLDAGADPDIEDCNGNHWPPCSMPSTCARRKLRGP